MWFINKADHVNYARQTQTHPCTHSMWFINKVEGQLCQATADHAGRLTHAPTACGSLIRLRVNYARLQLIMQADSPMHPQHVVH